VKVCNFCSILVPLCASLVHSRRVASGVRLSCIYSLLSAFPTRPSPLFRDRYGRLPQVGLLSGQSVGKTVPLGGTWSCSSLTAGGYQRHSDCVLCWFRTGGNVPQQCRQTPLRPGYQQSCFGFYLHGVLQGLCVLRQTNEKRHPELSLYVSPEYRSVL
jgi:hypothetical protein